MVITRTISKERIISVSLGVTILCLFSQMQIPIKPVPISSATIAVMLLGLLFASKDALFSCLLYISLGACGLPVFAGYNSGVPYLLGPTGGYLLGYAVASYSMSYLREKINRTSFVYTLLYCSIGNVCLYSCGLLWLMTFMRMSFHQAANVGILPFIIPGCIKIIALATLLRLIRK